MWDDSVYYIETATRERYENDPYKPWKPRKTNAARFAELLEAIVLLCAASDGPVTPNITRGDCR